jgi:hypothetical protein
LLKYSLAAMTYNEYDDTNALLHLFNFNTGV